MTQRAVLTPVRGSAVMVISAVSQGAAALQMIAPLAAALRVKSARVRAVSLTLAMGSHVERRASVEMGSASSAAQR